MPAPPPPRPASGNSATPAVIPAPPRPRVGARSTSSSPATTRPLSPSPPSSQRLWMQVPPLPPPPSRIILCAAGVPLDQRDSLGCTPLVALGGLLERGQYSLVFELAGLLLARSDCDVNSVNTAGRSLLSLSAAHLDHSVELTRLLLNHGARVWPGGPGGGSVAEITRDREQSAFTWFLRAVINQRSLADSRVTLACLAHEVSANLPRPATPCLTTFYFQMGRQPGRMRGHTVRVMLHEGRHPKVLGPVFLQLKLLLSPFWAEPPHLRYLACNSVRRSLGPRRLGVAGGRVGGGRRLTEQLGLPRPLTQYLTLAPASNRQNLN